jgi:hypothetical protein
MARGDCSTQDRLFPSPRRQVSPQTATSPGFFLRRILAIEKLPANTFIVRILGLVHERKIMDRRSSAVCRPSLD